MNIPAHEIQPGDAWVDAAGDNVYLGNGVIETSSVYRCWYKGEWVFIGTQVAYGDCRDMLDARFAPGRRVMTVQRPDDWEPTPEQKRWCRVIAAEAAADDLLADAPRDAAFGGQHRYDRRLGVWVTY